MVEIQYNKKSKLKYFNFFDVKLAQNKNSY